MVEKYNFIFFQGFENEIDTMVQTAAQHVFSVTFNLCKVIGELTFATDTKVTVFERSLDVISGCGDDESGDETAAIKVQKI